MYRTTAKKKGFSFIEILIGMVILQVALLSFFLINQSSRAQSLDAYYEFLAHSLGNEVIEFCQGMGYKWASKYADSQDIFPLDEWHPVLEKPIFSESSYFRESEAFERYVSFSPLESDAKGVLVSIDIRVVGSNRASAWLSREQVSFATLIVEKPQR